MRALVTGANGFIGSHLCELLLARGHSVRALVRSTSDLQWISGLGLELVYGEMRDPESLCAAVAGMDWVFHAAAVLRPRSAEEFLCVNSDGTRMLAEAGIEAGVQRFIFFSSAAAAGPARGQEAACTEDQQPLPVSAYGRGKLQAEQALAELRERLGSVILRFPAVYGPRDRDILLMFKAITRGVMPEFGGTFSAVYVGDAVRAALLAAERPVDSGAVYCISDGEAYRYSDVAAIAGQLLGRRPLRVKVPGWALGAAGWLSERFTRHGSVFNRDKARELSQACWVCAPDRARAELGYTAEYSFERGMSETFRWYRQQGWL